MNNELQSGLKLRRGRFFCKSSLLIGSYILNSLRNIMFVMAVITQRQHDLAVSWPWSHISVFNCLFGARLYFEIADL